MPGFDFRDMMGGASVQLGDVNHQIAITAIGRAMFHPIAEQARLHGCSPADVICSAFSYVAILYAKGGEPETGKAALAHIATIAQTISRAIDEAEAERG
jgi:hypothetical protein